MEFVQVELLKLNREKNQVQLCEQFSLSKIFLFNY